MEDVEHLIAGLGGPTLVAAEFGFNVSAITNWQRRGAVPAEHHLRMWALALAKGVNWTPPGSDRLAALLNDRAA